MHTQPGTVKLPMVKSEPAQGLRAHALGFDVSLKPKALVKTNL